MATTKEHEIEAVSRRLVRSWMCTRECNLRIRVPVLFSSICQYHDFERYDDELPINIRSVTLTVTLRQRDHGIWSFRISLDV